MQPATFSPVILCQGSGFIYQLFPYTDAENTSILPAGVSWPYLLSKYGHYLDIAAVSDLVKQRKTKHPPVGVAYLALSH